MVSDVTAENEGNCTKLHQKGCETNNATSVKVSHTVTQTPSFCDQTVTCNGTV